MGIMENLSFREQKRGSIDKTNVSNDIVMDMETDPHPESLMSVGERLDIMWVALGYAHKSEFARDLGIKPQTLNHYLRGNTELPYPLRLKLWQMGAHPGWLLHGDKSGLTVAFAEKVAAVELIRGLSGPREGQGGL